MQHRALHIGSIVAACTLLPARGVSTRSGHSFTERAVLRASDRQPDDEFGGSVGISGGTAIVGARYEDGGAGDPISYAGSAYVFAESFVEFFIGDLGDLLRPADRGPETRRTPWPGSPHR